LEFMSHQIENLSSRFINKNELITNDAALRRYHLYIHWCAKEALYKINDKQDINFKQNIIIKPFKIEKKGELSAVVDNKFGKVQYKLHYEEYKNYVIVWLTK